MRQFSSHKSVFSEKLFKASALAMSVGLISACGGSSSSDDSAGNDTQQLTGEVFAAEVSGAEVSVLDSEGNVLAGPATTNEEGRFVLEVAASVLASPFVLAANGGSYTDESTGQSTQAGEMLLRIGDSEFSEGQSLTLSPGSTIIAHLVRDYGISLAEARSLFEETFGYLPNPSISPANATMAMGDATAEERSAGLRAAVFSQLTHDMGMNPEDQFELLAALSEDLSDGRLDGLNEQEEIRVEGDDESKTFSRSIKDDYVDALFNFRDGDRNQTGLGNAEIGRIPLADRVQTTSYQIAYSSIGMTQQGKSQFSLTVTDENELPVSGVTPELMPMMHMAMHNHGTPHEGCTSTDEEGTSTCTIYYLMASEMASGESMGYWKLTVSVNGEEAKFVPAVMMAMGDTVRAVLKGVEDTIPAHMSMNHGEMNGDGMSHDDMDHGDMHGDDMSHEGMDHDSMSGGQMDHGSMSAMAMDEGMSMDSEHSMDMTETEPRSYYLFNDGLVAGESGYNLSLFIAAKNSMKSYPAVATGGELANGDMSVQINNVHLEASVAGGDWVSAEESGDGHYIIRGIQGLTAGTDSELKISLMINGEQKTTDGMAVSDTNAYATFFVNPTE